MHMVDFSFIIPVYNAEKTINRCLDSIKAQQHDNFEVIIMDDGSSDGSYEKCMRYQIEDQRFRVYHQENAGPSAARNRCFDYVNGAWICFVDSDDTINEHYLDSLYDKIKTENSEIIFFGYRQIDIEGKTVELKLPDSETCGYYETLVELSSKDMFGYTWIKSFRRDAIGDIRFDEKLNLFEDEVFTCRVLVNCRKVSIVNESIYDYYIDSVDALTRRTHQDYCRKCNEVYLAWEELLNGCATASAVLVKKANSFVERCKYYGFERPVIIKEFYSDLAETSYFALSDHSNNFRKYVLNHNYTMLRIEKLVYNFKITLAKMIGKLKR